MLAEMRCIAPILGTKTVRSLIACSLRTGIDGYAVMRRLINIPNAFIGHAIIEWSSIVALLPGGIGVVSGWYRGDGINYAYTLSLVMPCAAGQAAANAVSQEARKTKKVAQRPIIMRLLNNETIEIEPGMANRYCIDFRDYCWGCFA
ncbi:hypothetical protein [Edwardsiella tarda]|uniref:hypothetical protein n=1 Tax=Edwardsiella tarda TaxID=636 RepID=UPI00351C5849